MERSEFRLRMNQFKQARESNPLLSYWEWKSIPKHENGTDGIQSNTSEIPVTYSNGRWNYGYNPGAGFLKPVVSILDAADLTPVGNAIMANDVYLSASQGDYITAGLIGAAALLPGAISKPLKKIIREIPSVNPKYFSDKINKILGKEVRPNGLSRDVYTDAINLRNRVIEDLYTDLDYWNRARAINELFGDNYEDVYKNVLDTYENKYTGLPEPKAKSFVGDTRAEMAARKDAINRFRMNRIPAGYTDFEYNISPHLDRIDRPTALHELGHYVDFNLAKSSNADYGNNMFRELKKDLSTSKNPLYPDQTDYFKQGTEQKSYMNTLRSYMLSIGLIDKPGLKVTTKTIKRAINSLPSEMNAVRAAYLQFDSPGKYTKWFNKIPLLGIPGAAMYLDSKEDNSYADGTSGIDPIGDHNRFMYNIGLPSVSTLQSPIIWNTKEESKKLENLEELQLREILNNKYIKKLKEKELKRFNNNNTIYYIPHIKDKEIKLTNAGSMTGAVISTNVLDSLYKYSNKVGIPLVDAIGLPALESTFGSGYRYDNLKYKNALGGYSPIDILSDWAYAPPIEATFSNNLYDSPLARFRPKETEKIKYVEKLFMNAYNNGSEDAYYYSKLLNTLHNENLLNFYNTNEKKLKNIVEQYDENLPPIEHAFKLYKEGKYNPGDPNHSKKVRKKGEEVMNSPQFKKWAKKKNIL